MSYRVKMTAAKKQAERVFVVSNSWSDRHGEEGFDTSLFTTRAEAIKALEGDVLAYLSDFSAIKDGKVDPGVVDGIDGKPLREPMPIDDLKKLCKKGWLEINVDSSGTGAEWTLSAKAPR